MITVTCKDFNELKDFAREILGITDEPEQSAAPAMKNPEKPAPVPEPEAPKEEAPAEPKTEKGPEEVSYNTVDVRAKLAELNKAGKRDVVAKLLGECGAKKLSDVDPSKYGWLMEKAGEA